MDNVTHTLAGLLVGETAAQLRRRRTGHDPSPGFRTAAALAAAIGANLPDADLLYTALAPGKLNYLLHHRGHTHTLVAALVAIPLLWGAALVLWARFGTRPPGAGDRRWLLGAVAAAVFSHVALDWTNNYGMFFPPSRLLYV